MYLERKHKGFYSIAMDHSMGDISEVSVQPLRSSNVDSTGLLSIRMPESLCVTVTVAKELVTCLMVMPCLNKGS